MLNNKPKKIFLYFIHTKVPVFFACAVLLLFSQCGTSQSPEDVVTQFFQLAQQKKDAEAAQLFSKDLREGLNNDASAIESIVNMLTENRSQFQLEDVQILDDEATVGGNLTLNDDQKTVMKKSIKLALEEGIWKITNR